MAHPSRPREAPVAPVRRSAGASWALVFVGVAAGAALAIVAWFTLVEHAPRDPGADRANGPRWVESAVDPSPTPSPKSPLRRGDRGAGRPGAADRGGSPPLKRLPHRHPSRRPTPPPRVGSRSGGAPHGGVAERRSPGGEPEAAVEGAPTPLPERVPPDAAPTPLPERVPPDAAPTPLPGRVPPREVASPSTAPAVRPALRITHRPVTRAVVGTRVKLRVQVDGPADSEVVAFVGPPDGPHRKLRLQPVGGGVWQGEFDVDGSLAGGAVYWIVASHPDTDPTRVLEGSRFKPLRITVY